MSLPTLIELAREDAVMMHYKDGALWYQILWTDASQNLRVFEFPVPTNAPALEEVCRDVVDCLRECDGEVERLRDALQVAVEGCTARGAGSGEFHRRDKGIRFLKWIRTHLEMLQAAREAAG